MCIFIGSVSRVAKTRILVAPLAGERQLTVYENDVKSIGDRNAMILPVPSGGQGVQLIDMSNITDLFADCEAYFPEKRDRGGVYATGFGGGANFSFGSSAEPLPVQRIGGYMCSIVPTIDDFVRLARSTFTLPDNIESVLKTHYGTGFSFVVCTFNRAVAGHPIAYTSARLSSGQCFVPTRHAHGGETVDATVLPIHNGVSCDGCGQTPVRGNRWKCSSCPNYDLCDQCYAKKKHERGHLFIHIPRPISNQSNAGDDFDHTIYLMNAVLVGGPASYTKLKAAASGSDTPAGWGRPSLRFAYMAALVGPGWRQPAFMTKVTIRGNYDNADYVCAPVN